MTLDVLHFLVLCIFSLGSENEKPADEPNLRSPHQHLSTQLI